MISKLFLTLAMVSYAHAGNPLDCSKSASPEVSAAAVSLERLSDAIQAETSGIPQLIEFAKTKVMTVPYKPLKRVVLYHYRSREEWIQGGKTASSQDEKIISKLKSAIKDGIGTAGRGFYTAIDVAASRGYGGNDFILLELELQNDARLIDIADAPIPVPAARELAEKYHCYDMNLKNLFTMGTYDNTSSPGCFLAVNEMIQQLHLSGAMYDWFASQSHRLCDHDRNEKAVTIFDEKAVDFSKLKVYTSTSPDHPEGLAEVRRLEALFRGLPLDPVTEPKTLWPQLTISPDDQEKSFSWARESWFGCTSQ